MLHVPALNRTRYNTFYYPVIAGKPGIQEHKCTTPGDCLKGKIDE